MLSLNFFFIFLLMTRGNSILIELNSSSSFSFIECSCEYPILLWPTLNQYHPWTLNPDILFLYVPACFLGVLNLDTFRESDYAIFHYNHLLLFPQGLLDHVVYKARIPYM